MENKENQLRLHRLGIDNYKEAVVYMRVDCHVCKSEGFTAHARVRIFLSGRSIIATLNMVTSDILQVGHVSLSEYAWGLLSARENDVVTITHALPVLSLSYIRSKIYGNILSFDNLQEIINDITAGRYSDIQISAFLSACAGGRMNMQEITDLTQAMINVGTKFDWDRGIIVDKHCVGGVPGNRTTPIVVSIVAAYGMVIPKTSSRAITSPAGTADTMEVLCPVDLDVEAMRKVVEQENGCFVWGGAVALSPADDLLIQVERALDLDGEGQLVASIISKKVSAGSNHILIDIPVGTTAKVRTQKMANVLKSELETVAENLGVKIKCHISDGTSPIGQGIGPALEARDLVAVLQRNESAPIDLKERSIELAGYILEFSPDINEGDGAAIARDILESGQAWDKFQSICKAQGGMREIPQAQYKHIVYALADGVVGFIDNRMIARLAKLAGAPSEKTAGLDLFVAIAQPVKKGDPLYAIHAGSSGELAYSLAYLNAGNPAIHFMEQ